MEKDDGKLLLALLSNARQSFTQLAKTTGLTLQQVRYNVKKLEEQGIIQGYRARINQSKFCAGIATLLFKLRNPPPERFASIITCIQNHPAVNWCSELCGSADLVLTFLYKDTQDLSATVTTLIDMLDKDLQEHTLALYINELKFDRSGLLTEKEPTAQQKNMVSFQQSSEINVDKPNQIILSALAENCRTSAQALTLKTKLSEDAIRLRIQQLEKKEIISGYTLVINPSVLGFEAYYLGLQFKNLQKSTLQKIRYYAHLQPMITFCVQATGKYNIIMTLHAKNRMHFREMLNKLRTTFAEELLTYEFQLSLQEYKEIFVPPAYLKSKNP